MEKFIVIPCLNEQEYLRTTCMSLGFGRDLQPVGRLVLVDNGSSDGTLAIMAEIREAAPADRVLIVQEPKRGYVSARGAGIEAVLRQTDLEHISADATLVLQADADTLYLPGYVEKMEAACSGLRGQLLEGSAVTSREFNAQFPEFTKLCREVDEGMEGCFASEVDQVVVDDKVCAFLLADYCRWGGHRDESDAEGRPVYAETTRLFMHAKRHHRASRRRVDDAQALPSRRKLLTQATGYFASSGFPRDAAWIMQWGVGDESRGFLESPRTWPNLARLIRSRQRHQLALFGLLPALSRDNQQGASADINAVAAQMRAASLSSSPAALLGSLLRLADEENGALAAMLAQR